MLFLYQKTNASNSNMFLIDTLTLLFEQYTLRT